MAAPVNVQNDWVSASAVSSIGITLLSVTAGNLLVGTVQMQGASAGKTYSFSDDKSNTWAEAIRLTGANTNTMNRVVEIEYAKNVASGDTTITSTVNSGTANWEMGCQEVSGADTTAPLDQTGSFDASSSSTDHHCAASTAIDTAVDVFVVANGLIHSASTLTKNANFTRWGNTGSGTNMLQYRSSASALTDERATWTSTANRADIGVIASFKAPTGSSALVGTAAMVFSGTNTLTGSGALVGSSAIAFAGTNTLLGSGALAGAMAMVFSESATLAGAGALSGSSDLVFAGTNTLTGAGALAGSSALVFTNSAFPDLPSGSIVGISAMVFGGTGALGGSGALLGSSALQLSLAGVLNGEAPIAGTSALVFSNTSALTGEGALAGAAAMIITVAATLGASGDLAGTSAMVFGATLDASQIITLTVPGVELRLPNNRLEFQLQV